MVVARDRKGKRKGIVARKDADQSRRRDRRDDQQDALQDRTRGLADDRAGLETSILAPPPITASVLRFRGRYAGALLARTL